LLPAALLKSLQNVTGFDKEAFEKVHASGEQVTSIRTNPAKKCEIKNVRSAVPWSQYGYYLDQRPSFTFDPLFHAGCYYVQEASSMFLEQALKQTVDLSQPLKVLDLCAAPGGKSTHIQSLLSPQSILVSNEVIKSRNNILIDNIIKWGCNNVVVTQNDAKGFAALENYFDVIVADAPCSGSGLFRRDEDAINEWSLHNVQLCCQRQQRILADILPALKKGGVLIYSTCSYSKEEDEDIMQWLVQENDMQNLTLDVKDDWNIVKTVSESDQSIGYRFFPDKVKGEGFFLACFKKNEGGEFIKPRHLKKPTLLSKKEIETIKPWIQNDDFQYYHFFENAVIVPAGLQEEINIIHSILRVTYFGTKVGVVVREKLIPDHALAMSNLVAAALMPVDLTKEQAIKYLQRKEMDIEIKQRGWQLVSFEDHPLGWINVLPNRINNYYPKALRILKEFIN
jgi:16S rRNA C967 or C1407 C5-methylase (RsmB/RsmF family)/NOL1/NOP2/fmu family ribosome biogenesis protein